MKKIATDVFSFGCLHRGGTAFGAKAALFKLPLLLTAFFSICATFAASETPQRAQPKALKVLMIGNSFSVCLTNQMPQVAAAMGLKLDLASCYIGGCSLERHWKNMSGATNAMLRPYQFDRFRDGCRVGERERLNLPEALRREKWDVVTLQQASHDSWNPKTYAPFFDSLRNEIKKKYAPQAEIVWQETWSYTPFDKRLAKFGFDQNEMYRRIHRAAYDLAAANGMRVIPMGTAVQLWRERLPVRYDPTIKGVKKFGKDLTGSTGGDPFHLNKAGYYVQALVWTAKLFGVDVRACPYAPKWIPAEEVALMKEVAWAAVQGDGPSVARGGTGVPGDVAAGLERIKALSIPDCEIVETDYAPGRGLRVGCVLRPTPVSFIRCEVGLPEPQKWNGRLWGLGNGGWAGWTACTRDGVSACVHNDLGTSRYAIKTNPIDPEILKDFGWRATHLSTVVAKELIRTFYGRLPDHSYFRGCSTGGGQGFCEAQRFPEDYDGIIAEVPGFDRLVRATLPWREERLYRQYGKRFTTAEKKTIRQAELDFFAATDPDYARGNFILDPRPTKEKLDGCWRAIVKADPKLADREPLWRALFEPVVVKGRRLSSGAAIGVEFYGSWTFLLEKRTGPRKIPDVSEEEILAFADDPDCRFNSTDYARFKARGGKIILYGGFEDLSCPVTPMCEYYDEVVAREGSVAAAQSFIRHFVVPGRTHGARGEPSGAGKIGWPRDLRKTIVDWVEKGEAPEKIVCDWTDKSGRTLTVWPYPSERVECK